TRDLGHRLERLLELLGVAVEIAVGVLVAGDRREPGLGVRRIADDREAPDVGVDLGTPETLEHERLGVREDLGVARGRLGVNPEKAAAREYAHVARAARLGPRGELLAHDDQIAVVDRVRKARDERGARALARGAARLAK